MWSAETHLFARSEIHRFRREYQPGEAVLYFNLFNNMWGTNFPQWIGGSLRWDFTLFGYEGTCDGRIMDRALALDRGAYYLPLEPFEPKLFLPDGMEILGLKPCGREAWRLTLRDTGLTEREGHLRVPGWTISPADLRGQASGEPSRDICESSIRPFGVYGFDLKR